VQHIPPNYSSTGGNREMSATISSFLCCFCGGEIERRNSEPLLLTIHTSPDNKDQWWWCHASCFKERLANDPAGIFEPAHF
jgi:hypothetical protein